MELIFLLILKIFELRDSEELTINCVNTLILQSGEFNWCVVLRNYTSGWQSNRKLVLLKLRRSLTMVASAQAAASVSHPDVKKHSGAKSHVRQDLKFTHMDRHHQWYKTQCSNELHK